MKSQRLRPLVHVTRGRCAALAILAVSLAAGGCGAGTPAPRTGWLDGSPAAADAENHVAADERFGASDGRLKETGVPAPGIAAKPVTIDREPTPTTAALEGLKAGSVDDNVAFDAFLKYRTGFLDKKLDAHDIDVSRRVLVHVKNAAGEPILGADVTIVSPDGTVLGSARSDVHGLAVLFPEVTTGTQQAQGLLRIDAKLGEAKATTNVADRSDESNMVLATDAVAPKALDVLFLIDATGSMGDEITRLRDTMASVSERVSKLPGAPDVRFGLTVFRDRGDAFVTRTFDFTGDVSKIETALKDVEAGGGGDTPESVNAGLHDALAKPTWRDDSGTVRLVFLIGDAAPHLDYQSDPDYISSARDAAKRGIAIEPIASSGLDDQGEYIFRQTALLTGGRFSFLTYGADGESPGTTTKHHVSGYDTLSLDDLVVRMIQDEIGAKDTAPTPQQP